MDDAFDKLLDILNDNIDDADTPIMQYDELLQASTDMVRQIQIPNINIQTPRELIEIFEFDPENNILDAVVRDEFKTECIFNETHLFTRPISTTNTMEGYLSNVSFHERDLIEELIPDENIVIYRCNYGKIRYDGYTEPVKIKKTNRGRKKRIKNKKPRKKQGDGIDFNSQITFITRSTLSPIPPDGIIPINTKVYKFKIFRTGKLQLPGVRQHNIDDVILCVNEIIQVLNFYLHPGETNLARRTDIININPVMKNYKFVIRLPANHIIDMDMLRRILRTERANQFNNEHNSPPHPNIFMLKYTRQDTKLSIKFSTPIYKKPKKKTRINIFMRGKVNILGAFDARITRQICEYLHWLFDTNYSELIVPEGSVHEREFTWIDNISDVNDLDVFNIMYTRYLPPLDNNDFNEILAFASAIYDEQMSIAEQFINEHLSDLL